MKKKKALSPQRILFFVLCILLSATISAQNAKTITGTVSEKDGTPVIGASVIIKGTNKGTASDIEGNFTIQATDQSVLTVSYLGYATRTIEVKGSTNLKIIMQEDSKVLDEFVVVGYGVMKKSDLTGSVSSVSADKLKDKPVANLGDALQGQAAGVQILTGGVPGSNASIQIRGLGTINNSSPLLVIDGIPTEINLNSLNMDDVESVDVLKDASATSIYGSRGANGVVLITTKGGRKSDGTVSVKINYAVQEAAKLPKLLNASQFASMQNEMLKNRGLSQNPEFADPILLGAGTDWVDALFSSALMKNYTVSYSGGTENSSYYLSGGLFDQEGIVKNTSYRRYTIQINGESNVYKWLKIGNRLTMNHDVKKNGGYDIRGTMASLPTQPIYDEDGNFSGPGSNSQWYGDLRNPIGTAEIEKNETKGYNALGNVYAEVTLFDKLKVKTTAGIEVKFWDTRNVSPAYDWKPIANPNTTVSQSSNKALTYLWDNIITYNETFGKKHSINAMLGSSAQWCDFEYLSASSQGFLSEDYSQLNTGILNQTAGGSRNDWALLSFFGRLNYTYDNKYLATVTVRHDGSSRFSKKNRWGTFPSFALAWRLSEESFFNKSSILSDVKLRAGFGITGNQNDIDSYAYANILTFGQYVINGKPVTTLYPYAMPNPDVKWESVKQSNIGVDLTFLNQRIILSADAYYKKTTDMLMQMSVPVMTGYLGSPSINAGEVENKGIELTLSTHNLKGLIEWNTNLNVSFNKNKILKLHDGVPIYLGERIHAEGQPIGSFYGYLTNGIFQTQEEVDNYAVQVAGADPNNRTSPGDIRFFDLDNSGAIKDNDRTFIGNPTPEWSFGITNSLAYGNFDFEVFLQGVAGNDIYNATRVSLEGMSSAQNQTTRVLDRWTGPGTSNSIPRAVYGDPNNNTRTSDRFVEDGSYLRIKNITLGYTLPKNISQKAYMSSARIYVSCQNLYTFTKYSGMDPEVGAVDNGTYPVTRTISAGVNINF